MIKVFISLMATLISQVVCSYGHSRGGSPLGQPAFHVCAKPLTGVTYLIQDGLDADHGAARNKRGVVQVLIGRPSAFFDSPFVSVAPRPRTAQARGRRIVMPGHIPREMALVGALGPTEKEAAAVLYGYSPESAEPRGAQDPILVLLQANKGAGSVELIAVVGKALYRCD